MNAPVTFDPQADEAFRASHIGGSEVSALFDCCPYLTRFELWHRKAGNVHGDPFNAMRDDGSPDNERIYWGVMLEPAIIEGAKQRWGYTDREQLANLSNGKGLGGHPDRRVICPERGPGILEVKTADWLVRKDWGDEPPAHYLLQAQTYAGLDGVKWCDVIVLVGGNTLERFCYDFRPKIFAEIEKRVAAFWATIEAGQPPKPDYSRDLATITDLYRQQADKSVDLTGDNLAAEAAAQYLVATAEAKAAEAKRDAAKAELMDKIGEANFGQLSGFIVRTSQIAGIADREAQPGEIIKGRKPYRRLTVKEQNQ